MKPRSKIIKIISPLLIILVLVPSIFLLQPKQANAQWYTFSISDFWNALTSGSSSTTATTNSAKLALAVKAASKEILRQVEMTVARKALQEITKSTVNWINSGFHGSPLFLENPQSFFQDIAKTEVKTLVDIFGYDSVKYPFGKAFALNAINAYKAQLADNTAYTLSGVLRDPVLERNYRENFSTGGWTGFLVNTQYQQNNYLGFQMKATEELARRVQNTDQPAAKKIQTALQNGLGFLSPQICDPKVNAKYNNLVNEFQKPAFDQAGFDKAHANDDPNSIATALIQAHAQWGEKNECKKADGTSGLVSTTPGSVVANQITTAMGSQFRQTELGAAVGGSLSTIFDALLAHFLDKGLNSLATNINPQPENQDTWNYNGLSLGVTPGEGGVNNSWANGPEVVITLADLTKKVNDGITNTTQELALMNQESDYMNQIWPEGRKLDVCLPGPDLGWQDRLQNEVQRSTKKLQTLSSDDNAKKATDASLALKELKFAVDFFKDWINNKMITELPNSINYMENIDAIKPLSQENTELTDAKRTKIQALARLQAIKIALSTIKSEPLPGSAGEKTLISIQKQYDGINADISTSISLSDRKNTVSVKKDQLESLKKATIECEGERKAAGWGLPAGATSSFSGNTNITSTNPSAPQKINGLALNSEQAIFCDLPITGGYNHETFINQTGITHPEIPLVNGQKILRYEVVTIKSILTSLSPGTNSKAAYVNINLSCNNIFNAKLLDYKGSLSGLTTVTESAGGLPPDTGNGETGTCTYDDGSTDKDVTEEECTVNNGTWVSDTPPPDPAPAPLP